MQETQENTQRSKNLIFVPVGKRTIKNPTSEHISQM